MHCSQSVCLLAEQAVCQHSKHSWEGSPPGIGDGAGLGVGEGVGVGDGEGVGTGDGAGEGVGEPPLIPKQVTMSEYGMFWQ